MEEKQTINPFTRFLRSYIQTEPPATDTSSPVITDGHLVLDMYDQDNHYHITAPTAGVLPDDVDIELNEDYIVIKGERHERHQESDKNFIFQECYWGSFSRRVDFPTPIDPENATATFKDGMLHIAVPKAKSALTRTLKIKTL